MEGLTPDELRSGGIGNEYMGELLCYCEAPERWLYKKARMEMPPPLPGDVPDTEADVSDLATAVGYRPRIPVEEGVKKFVDWYKMYYHIDT